MTAQTELAFDSLNLGRGAWLISQVVVNYATHRLEIAADYDEGRPFLLIFKDFHLLSWQIPEDEFDPRDVNADVIGLDFGEREQRKLASITTDRFEIILTYGELEIEKTW